MKIELTQEQLDLLLNGLALADDLMEDADGQREMDDLAMNVFKQSKGLAQ